MMRTLIVHIANAALAFGALTACAQPPRAATTSTTSADIIEPAPPAAREDSALTAASTATENVPGQLACKAKDPFGVVTELYLDGDKGTLHRHTPSGNLEEQPLKLARHGDVLFGDEPASEDLAVHAVTVRQAQGKTFLRLGDWNQTWSTCQ